MYTHLVLYTTGHRTCTIRDPILYIRTKARGIKYKEVGIHFPFYVLLVGVPKHTCRYKLMYYLYIESSNLIPPTMRLE